MADPLDLGPDLSHGPQGPDRSLLAHVLKRRPRGWAAEFGVGGGETLRMIAAVMPVIGFDSFRGLPQDWRPGFRRGKFAGHRPDPIPGTTIVPGWFADTLPGYDFGGVGLFHIDCDLYESATTVLDAIEPYLSPGAIVVFDEFHGFDDDLTGPVPGEQRAWLEIVERTGVRFKAIGHGREQVAFRITRGPS